LFPSGNGRQYQFGEAAAPPGGPGVEVLRMSSTQALFSAATPMFPVGVEATHSTDVAQSSACYPIQGTFILTCYSDIALQQSLISSFL